MNLLLNRNSRLMRKCVTQWSSKYLKATRPTTYARAFSVRATTAEATGNTGKVHRSDAEELVNKVPVVAVDGPTALCDGGGGSLGHPIEFIQLNNKNPHIPAVCKYCGVRYIMKQHWTSDL